MTAKKRRGRPPSAATIERRRAEAMLKNLSAHAPQITRAERQQAEESFYADEIIRKEILKDYKHSATIPDEHAYAMASLGDESLEGYEDVIISRDEEYRKVSIKTRRAGTKATRDAAEKWIKPLFKKNKLLIGKIKPNGLHTIRGVARIIVDEWGHRGVVEWELRGVGGKHPSEKTIRNHLRKHLE
jgi:hypothetical protein